MLNVLREAKFENAGEILENLAIDEGQLLDVSGVGPKALEEIKAAMDGLEFEEPEPEVEVEEVIEEPVEARPELVFAADGAEVEPSEAEEEPVAVMEVAELTPEPALEGLEVAAQEPAEETEPSPEAVSFEDAFESISAELDMMVGAKGDEDLEEEIEEDEVDLELEEDKKRKKRKKRVVEYDPESGEMVVRRRRKKGRQDEEWDSYL